MEHCLLPVIGENLVFLQAIDIIDFATTDHKAKAKDRAWPSETNGFLFCRLTKIVFLKQFRNYIKFINQK